jgi:hypothetical protein
LPDTINTELRIEIVTNCIFELSYEVINQANTYTDFPNYSIAYVSKLFQLEYRQHQAFVKCCLYLLWKWSEILNFDSNFIDSLHKQYLGMHILGSAGTGKSRDIKAIFYFAQIWNMQQTVIATSFTGTAAKNAGGVNMHSFSIGHY